MPRWAPVRVKPPFGDVQVNWGHPLADALLVCILATEGGGVLHDLTGATVVTPTGTATWAGASGGIVKTYDGSTQADAITNIYTGGGAITMLIRTAIVATSSFFRMFSLYDGSHGCELGGDAPGTRFTFADEAQGTVCTGTSDPTAALGVPVDVCGTQNGTAMAIYVNGVQESTATGGTASNSGSHYLGARQGASLWTNMQLSHAFLYKRALSAGEVGWLSKEPYAMLQPIRARRYFVPTGGPTVPQEMPGVEMWPIAWGPRYV